jgi:tetratricopeptide (TPR) repeat protein
MQGISVVFLKNQGNAPCGACTSSVKERWKRQTSFVITFFCIAVSALAETGGDLARANELYERTDYSGALHVLLAQKNPDARAYALAGKSSFMEGDLGKAADFLQKAVALDPANSEYVLWLGRVWGRKAEKANPFTAPRAAARAREYFEKAVALDPRNTDAMDDLFDFYLDAPGFLGGGLDKAEAIARRVEARDPAEGRFDLARVELKRKRPAEAEGHFRAAVNMAPKAVGHVIAFARFLAQQGRLKESDAILAEGEAAAPENPRLLYGRASIDIETHRNLSEARRLLERYLASNLTPDDPPREAAEKLLRQMAGS